MIARLWRHALPLTLATLVVLAAMAALEFFYFRSISGGLSSLGWRPFGFEPQDGIAWLTALGPRGAEGLLVWHYFSIDLVFPALLSVTLLSLLLFAGQKLPWFMGLRARRRGALAICIVAPYLLAHYAQNVVLIQILSDPQSANAETLSLASTLGTLKFAFLFIALFILACMFAIGYERR